MYEALNAYLENGLKIVLHQLPNIKTISCGLWVRQGSCHETDANNGLSHLAEHLLLNPENAECTRYRALIHEAAANGVMYNAATTKEYTYYYMTGLHTTLPLCLSALSCIAKENRSFPDELFENEKKVVLQEATGFYSSFQQIKERTGQAIWGNTGIGKIIMGDMKKVAEAEQSAILQIIKNAYVPGNSVLVVLGDFNYTDTLHMIEECFADWQDQPINVAEGSVDEEPGIYFHQSTGASIVFSVGFRAMNDHANDRTAAELMVRMLGLNGMQSRLTQEIRIKRGLSYTQGGFSRFYHRRGTIGFMAVSTKEKALETAKVTMEVLNEAKKGGFTEEEIHRAKRAMETSLLLSVNTITDHLLNIGRCSVMERDFYIEKELRTIRNLQKEEIEETTEEILQEANMGLAAMGECDIEKLMEAVVLDEGRDCNERYALCL